MPATILPRSTTRWLALLSSVALVLGLTFGPLAWSAGEATLHCATCGKVIAPGTRYIESNGKVYCSKECFEKSLPKCEICGAPAIEGAIIKGHIYCKVHATAPRCAICGLPAGPNSRQLPDGRVICSDCLITAVLTQAAAEQLYVVAQRDVQRVTGIENPAPPLHLVWADELAKLMPASIKLENHMAERGLYQREELTTTQTTGWGDLTDTKVTRTLNLLLGQSQAQFRVAAAHELTHDLTAEKFHALTDAPPWVQEGICQYVAAQVARQIAADEVLKAIETSPDSIYGPGYRFFAKLAGKQGWPAVRKWMEAADVKKLPAECPEK